MLQNPERRRTIQTQRDPSSAIDMMFSQDAIASPVKNTVSSKTTVSSLQSKLTGGGPRTPRSRRSLRSPSRPALQSGAISLQEAPVHARGRLRLQRRQHPLASDASQTQPPLPPNISLQGHRARNAPPLEHPRVSLQAAARASLHGAGAQPALRVLPEAGAGGAAA